MEIALAPTLSWNDLLLGSTQFGELANSHYHPMHNLCKHSSLAEIANICGSEINITEYQIIATVRDPIDRIISLYNFVSDRINSIAKQLVLSWDELEKNHNALALEHKVLTWPSSRAVLVAKGNFKTFLASSYLNQARAFKSQYAQLSLVGQLPRLLTWIRTEELLQAKDFLSDVSGTDITIPHANKSQGSWKTREDLSRRERMLLQEIFADDFIQFGYSG